MVVKRAGHLNYTRLRSRPCGGHAPGPVSSECFLLFAAFLARVLYANLPLSRRNAIWRAALSTFALYTSHALLNRERFTLQRLFDQPFGLFAHGLF